MSSFLSLFHDQQISERLGSFLTTDEAVRVVLSTSLLYRAQDMNSPTCFHTRVFLKSSLLFGGCPPHLRSRAWLHWMYAKGTVLGALEHVRVGARLASGGVDGHGEEREAGEGEEGEEGGESSTHAPLVPHSVVSEIRRDLGRSFPSHALFATTPRATAAASSSSSSSPTSPGGEGFSAAATSATIATPSGGGGGDNTRVAVSKEGTPGLAMLQHVLLGFAHARPSVAYCQGTNYVAAMLVMLQAPQPYAGGRYRRRGKSGGSSSSSSSISSVAIRGATSSGQRDALEAAAAAAAAAAGGSSTAMVPTSRYSSSSSSSASSTTSGGGGGIGSWLASFFFFSAPPPQPLPPPGPPLSSTFLASSAVLSRTPFSPPTASKHATYDEVRCARALALLLALCDRLGLADVWRSGLPRLRLLGATLSDLVRRHLPLLHEKLERVSGVGGPPGGGGGVEGGVLSLVGVSKAGNF